MRKLVSFIGFSILSGCASGPFSDSPRQSSLTLFDTARQRPIAVDIHMPIQATSCNATHPCPVAIISSGYGISNKSYSFISSALSERGYLTVAVQHELPTDAPLATHGDLFEGRTPNWQRGAENLRFVHNVMRRSHPGFDWEHPVLIGHSNGGDISAWLVRESPMFADRLVTLDSRRVPLPRGTASTRLLSIRGSDFTADAGVLPAAEELKASGSCVVRLSDARHNDMHDGGPAELKRTIADRIVSFLADGTCIDSDT